MTMGSLFAGIGGFDLGFTRAGFNVSWQVEIDEWCRGILARHFPSAQRHADIRDTGAHNLAPVDVICGGFPCQPFSSAGKRGGTEDDRYLWPEMLRVIREVRPTWVVAENVNGLTVGEMVPVFEQVLSDLEGAGYEVQPFVIPACAVDAWHKRDRVWIIAHTDDAGTNISRKRGSVRDINGHREAKERERDELEHGPDCNAAPIPNASGQQMGHARLARVDAFGMGEWQPEPEMERMVHGLPTGLVERSRRAFGNAVVPQIPELFARIILETERLEALRRAAA